MHQAGHRLIVLIAAALALQAAAQPKPKPAATQPVPPGWEEIDQRLVFLTVQLSTIESSIDATDKALKLNGYQKIFVLKRFDDVSVRPRMFCLFKDLRT